MKLPPKPKKPSKRKAGGPCPGCAGSGRVKEWDEGPYPDWEWAKCSTCAGRQKLTAEELSAIDLRRYESDIAEYARKLAQHKILSGIKITRKQAEAISRYGMGQFLQDYLGA